MNPQELFIDVSSGRFLDGNSSIAISKPSIFSDEQKTLEVNVFNIKRNVVSAVTPAPNAQFKMRLGTAALKLSEGEDIVTAPPVLIRATGTVSTSPSSQATGSGIVTNYTPVTAVLKASVVSIATVTATFVAQINGVFTNVTAVICCGIGTYTVPTAQIFLPRS